jgi:membrane protease YdiL (CAAX protease family)
LPVTVAEILVCWALVGATFESPTKRRGKAVSLIVGIVAASVLFGVYHFAHSPPFNTFGLVLTLTLVGVITSLFFFISRNVYGTIVFHNFLGIFGVLQALTASGNLATYHQPMYPAYVLAPVSVIILIAADMRFVRRTHRLRTT